MSARLHSGNSEHIEVPHGVVASGTVASPEVRFVCLIAILVALMTTAPYVLGWWQSTPKEVFTGVLEHSDDMNNYLAYARQARSGQWLFHNPMTGEAHGNVFFNLEWLAIGKLAWLIHVSLPAAMNLLRILCIGLMSYAVYWFSSFFLCTGYVRRIALITVMLGGGFGWIAAVHLLHIRLDSSYFLDLTNGNLFPFYWMLKLPHFLVSEGFVVCALCFFLAAEHSAALCHYLLAGLCGLLAGSCRPYDMLYLMVTVAVYLGGERFV